MKDEDAILKKIFDTMGIPKKKLRGFDEILKKLDDPCDSSFFNLISLIPNIPLWFLGAKGIYENHKLEVIEIFSMNNNCSYFVTFKCKKCHNGNEGPRIEISAEELKKATLNHSEMFSKELTVKLLKGE